MLSGYSPKACRVLKARMFSSERLESLNSDARGSKMFRPALAITMAVACILPAWAADNPTLPMPAVAPTIATSRLPYCGATILAGPELTEPATHLAPSQPEPRDKPLPINLPTALRLSGARPLVIDAAQASLAVAAAQLEKARLLWLPSLAGGLGYYHHDG